MNSIETKNNFESCKELLYKISEEKFKITKEQLKSKKRTRELADTRRAIIKLLKSKFPFATTTIIGNSVSRDHSSVCTQLKNHDELTKTKNDYTERFNIMSEEFYKHSFNYSHSVEDLYEIKQNLEQKLRTVNLIIKDLESKKEPAKTESAKKFSYA